MAEGAPPTFINLFYRTLLSIFFTKLFSQSLLQTSFTKLFFVQNAEIYFCAK